MIKKMNKRKLSRIIKILLPLTIVGMFITFILIVLNGIFAYFGYTVGCITIALFVFNLYVSKVYDNIVIKEKKEEAIKKAKEILATKKEVIYIAELDKKNNSKNFIREKFLYYIQEMGGVKFKALYVTEEIIEITIYSGDNIMEINLTPEIFWEVFEVI